MLLLTIFLLKVNADQLEQINNAVMFVSSVKTIIHAVIQSPDFVISDEFRKSSDHLDIILDRLRSKTIQAGVVGVSKVGKSSLLNVLMRKTFLPSSVQPQTAKEVIIVHNPLKPNGELFLLDLESKEENKVAHGTESIQKYLFEFNEKSRHGSTITSCKLYLHAPLLPLEDKDDINFEISDTPGLGEAGGYHFTNESRSVLQDKAMFILVLNHQMKKTILEHKLMQNLSKYHPDLFTGMDSGRILVLVNKYEVVFESNGRGKSPSANDIPAAVSQYVKDLYGMYILPQNIIPISTKLAQNALDLQRGDDSTFSESELFLRKAGVLFKSVRLNKNESTMKYVSNMLFNLSNIPLFEERLRNWLHQNFYKILASSSRNDALTIANVSLTEINNVKYVIKMKVNELEEKLAGAKQSLISMQDRQNQMIEQLNDLVYPSLCGELEKDLNILVWNELLKRDSIEENNQSSMQLNIEYTISVISKGARRKINEATNHETENIHDTLFGHFKQVVSANKGTITSKVQEELITRLDQMKLQLSDSFKIHEVALEIHDEARSLVITDTKDSLHKVKKTYCVEGWFSESCDTVDQFEKDISTVYKANTPELADKIKKSITATVKSLNDQAQDTFSGLNAAVKYEVMQTLNKSFSKEVHNLTEFITEIEMELSHDEDGIKFLNAKANELICLLGGRDFERCEGTFIERYICILSFGFIVWNNYSAMLSMSVNCDASKN